jgi:hypothetical protein
VRNLSVCQNSRVSQARPGYRTARLLSAQRELRMLSNHLMTRAWPPLPYLFPFSSCDPQYRTCSYDRRKSDIDNERLPPIEERPPTSSPSFSPSTNGGTGIGPGATKGISAGVGTGTTNTVLGVPPATPFRRTREGRLASAQRHR